MALGRAPLALAPIFVLVADNPLADVRNMQRTEGVMVDGRWLGGAATAIPSYGVTGPR